MFKVDNYKDLYCINRFNFVKLLIWYFYELKEFLMFCGLNFSFEIKVVFCC